VSEPTHAQLRQVMNADRRRHFGDMELLALVCECGSSTCQKTLLLSREEYDAHEGPILHPDHVPSG
jgi:hypothetical protein